MCPVNSVPGTGQGAFHGVAWRVVVPVPRLPLS